jgi:penicillin G amidase
MDDASRDWLRRLGAGESVLSICKRAGITRARFDEWWNAELVSRVPDPSGVRAVAVGGPVKIERDAWGIPHLWATDELDLFFGFGYAMAADRLFQMDYLRRKASGTLSEVLGPRGLELDRLARTVGIRGIALAEWERLPAQTRALVDAFTRGVNALIEQTRDRPPIEFDLLDYRPAPWSGVDCMAIEGEFRWYLTGRLPVIVMPELARRALGSGPLYQAFLRTESDGECIVPAGSYDLRRIGVQPVGQAVSDPDAGLGSNNWVVAPARSATGCALVASDPHIAFEAVSCWYEVHLDGGRFQVAGMAYVGMPAVLFGRNQRVAWGCTNNICSLRDLYQERTDPAHPGCFVHDGRWEPAREREEVIAVRGREPVRLRITSSRNGPIVDDVLPAPARGTGPVALKWLGAQEGGWLTALLAMNRAGSATELREATRPWHVPSFTVVYADVDGHSGCQITGRIPIRKIAERGYRPGWDPAHQWQGLIPFDAMPYLADPNRGWIASANNRAVPDDYPYPVAGTWSNDLRARRIRRLIEAQPKLGVSDFTAMQLDHHSLRAQACVPHLLAVLARSRKPRVREAAAHLKRWDLLVDPDRVGATLFNVFFARWAQTVAAARFGGETAELLATGIDGLASALLAEDAVGWFHDDQREAAILLTFEAALDDLSKRLGPDMAAWTWGRLHILTLHHVLSPVGDLGHLFDRGGVGVGGDFTTVGNTGLGLGYEAKTGAGYRMIAELARDKPGLWSIDAQSHSGHPGSPHHDDQLAQWLAGRYHWIPMGRLENPRASLLLEPRAVNHARESG